jgi:hypothetical protein
MAARWEQSPPFFVRVDPDLSSPTSKRKKRAELQKKFGGAKKLLFDVARVR